MSEPQNDQQARVAELEAEIAVLQANKAANEEKVKELRATEDIKNGVNHAQEIFEVGQDKLRLEVEIKMRRVKINKIMIEE